MKKPSFDDLFNDAVEYQVKHYSNGVDPNTLRTTTRVMAEALLLSGADPAYAYAFCKTGLMPADLGNGQSNMDHRPKKDREEFEEAYDYFNFMMDEEFQEN